MSRFLGQQPQPKSSYRFARLLLILLGVPLLIIGRVIVGLHNDTSTHNGDAEAMTLLPQRNDGADKRRLNNNMHATSTQGEEEDGKIPANNDGNDGYTHRRDAQTSNDEEVHSQQKHGPLNIVLFYADDWSFRTLGAMEMALNGTNYKVPSFVKTPNIDRMAKNGVIFTHNCVTTSICMVSRASLYTGQYASKHKTFLPGDTAMYAEGVWNSTLFPLLKKYGYHNGMVGKWHHAAPPNKESDFGTFNSYFGSHYITRNGKEIHVSDANEMDAVEFLNKRPEDKPFALMVSFFAIHAEDGNPEQYRPQNRTRHLYQNQTVPIPKTATEEHHARMPPFLQNEANVGRGRWMHRYKTPELYQHMMKKTYRMITEVDTAVGNIIDKLKEQNVLDDTILMFTADNGNLHGEHGLAEKWYPYEESIRVPLVIVDPRMPQRVRNSINDEFTLNIDLAPTMLGAANIPIPEVMQGRDIAPMYMDPKENAKVSWRKEFYYEWFTGHKVVIPASLALVRKDMKYIIYPEYDYEELFHLKTDPYEERNILNSSLKTLEEVKRQFKELKAVAESGVKV